MDIILSLLFYMIIAIVSYFSMRIAQQRNEKKWILIPIITLSLVAGLRADTVGVDTDTYIRIFEVNMVHGFKYVHGEYGFYLISLLLMNIFQSPSFVFFVFGLIIYSLIYLRIWDFRNVANIGIASLLFILNYYGGSMNGLRQFVAIAIVFYGTRYIQRNKYVLYFLFVAIAFTFHTTACIGILLPLFYLDYKKIKDKYSKKAILVCLLAMVSVGVTIFIVMFNKYSHYFDNFKNIDLGIMVWVRLFICIFSYYFCKKKIRVLADFRAVYLNNHLFDILFRLVLFGLLFGFGNSLLDGISRIGYYFKFFEIIYYAVILHTMNISKIFRVALLCILIILGNYYMYAYNGTVPYHSIFYKIEGTVKATMGGVCFE